jgi:hypothetical protein
MVRESRARFGAVGADPPPARAGKRLRWGAICLAFDASWRRDRAQWSVRGGWRLWASKTPFPHPCHASDGGETARAAAWSRLVPVAVRRDERAPRGRRDFLDRLELSSSAAAGAGGLHLGRFQTEDRRPSSRKRPTPPRRSPAKRAAPGRFRRRRGHAACRRRIPRRRARRRASRRGVGRWPRAGGRNARRSRR